MNYAQKMWKRVLSFVLAVVLVLGMVPVTEAHAAEANSVELSKNTVELELNGASAEETVTVLAVYDENAAEVASDEYSVQWVSNDEEIVTVSEGTLKAVGRGTAEVTVEATYTKDDERKTSKGIVSVEVWETPSMTVAAEPGENPATYPVRVKFTAVTESQGSVTMSITKDGTETEYTAGEEVELKVGEYTVKAEVAKDADNFYKETEANLIYVVEKASTSETADVKSSVYWNEKINVTLPNQAYEGSYTVLAENLTVKKSDGVTVDSATELNAGEVLEVVADQDTGAAKLTVAYTPADAENYNEFVKEYPITVNVVPVKAVWEASFVKIYDGSDKYSVRYEPAIVLDGIEEFTGYKKPTYTNSNGYSFKLDSVNAGDRTATLKDECALVLDDTDHYTLADATPDIEITVKKVILNEEDVLLSNALGKAYDGTSEAVITATIKEDSVVGTELVDKKINVSFDAKYYTGEDEEFGDPVQNVIAEKIVLSNLKVMEDDKESSNYAFVDGLTIEVKDDYVISANKGFLKFTGMDSLGVAVNEERGEIHWFKEETTISKAGYEFSKEPKDLKKPVWEWNPSYTVNSNEPTVIYARNSSSKEVSGPICVAVDNTLADGQIFAQIGNENEDAVTITELTAEYKNLTNGSDVVITFEGADSDSKIAKVDYYGSNTAWTENDEAAWDNLQTFETLNVNEDSSKEAAVNLTLDSVTKEQELKKFYYARITDFAGNVSYVSSSGVLQDITAPTVKIALVEDTNTKTYEEKNVYEDIVGFTLDIKDEGKTSGISAVEVALKNNAGKVVKKYTTYTTAAKDIWTSTKDIADIQLLNGIPNPTEAQILAANKFENEVGLTAELTELEDGYYTLTAKVIDKVGNASAESSISFIKDSKEPVVEVVNALLSKADRVPEDGNLYVSGLYFVTVKEMTLTTEVKDLITGIDDVVENWETKVDSETGLVTKTITLHFGENAVYKEGYYNFEVTAKDSFDRTSNVGTGDFTIDYTAPTYTVKYSKVHENAYSGDTVKKTVNGTEYTREKLYYNGDIEATFTIDEATTYDDSLITILVKNSKEEVVIKWPGEDGKASFDSAKYAFKHDEGSNKFVLTIKGVAGNDDDGYTFEISGQDKAGNKLIPEDAAQEAEVNKVRALDVTAPELTSVVYDTLEKFNPVNGKDYVNADTTVTFTIKEHNQTDNVSTITNIEGNIVSKWALKDPEDPNASDDYITTLEVTQNGDYGDEQVITLTIVDKAGNVAVLENNIKLRSDRNTEFDAAYGKFTDKFTVDKVAPTIKLEYLDFNPDIPGRPGVNGIDYFRQPVTVKVTIDEHNFDTSLFKQLVDQTGDAVAFYESEGWTDDENNADIKTKTFTFDKDNQYNLSIEGTDNAKNLLVLETVDKVSATYEDIKDDNDDVINSAARLKVAVDQTLPAIGDTAKPVVVITPPKTENTTLDKQALYKSDVTYEVVVYDPLLNKYASGIDNISFTAKGEDGTEATCTVDKAGNIDNVNGTGLTVTIVEEKSGKLENFAQGEENKYTFNVKIASGTFNTNGIVLSVTAEDVSTNEKSMETKAIAIDVTAPKAVVSYSNNDVSNDKYFHAERIATITVTERNFSSDCYQFFVNGSHKKLDFKLSNSGSDKNRDDATWVASYTFGSDGDYKITGNVNDRATNKGTVAYSGEAAQDFTIDMTDPVVEIEFDNHNVFNENYYDAQRTATIIITEHNFDASDVVIIGEGTDAGVEVAYPSISSWSSSGDVHRATLTYAQDALYTLDVEYEDLATNVANDVDEERFTVDTTDPEVTITGVENETPYPDEVRPRIDFSDNNFDRYEAVLTRTERENIGVDVTEKFLGTIGVAVDATGKGVGGKLIEDIEHLEENDGIYTLTVTVYDKAGRSMEETVVYSVNRFGSVYVYSKDLSAMLKGYHQKAEGDLYITAYNADQLMEDSTKLEITCDGAALSNQGSQSDVADALQPNNGGWFEYKFKLDHADFENDGRYMITISDKDEAGNTRTNSDNPIEFYIDATAPVLDSVIGLEEAIVNANEQTVQYAISDAIALENVKIYVDDKEIDNIEEFESLTAHNSEFTIGGGMKQKVRIVAEDKAGNVLDTAEESFAPAFAFVPEITVSTNFFVRWYANAPLFWGSIAAIALAIGGGLTAVVAKKRKKQDEEE